MYVSKFVFFPFSSFIFDRLTLYFRNGFRDWIGSKSIIGRLRGKKRNLNLYWSENVLWSLLLNSVVFTYTLNAYSCWRHPLTKIWTTWNIKVEILASRISCELILRRRWNKKLKSGIVARRVDENLFLFGLIKSIFLLMENFISKKKKISWKYKLKQF